MADKSDIGWTDATWQIITGCSVDTPGCRICYAMDLAGTRLKNHPSRVGLTKVVNGRHVWTGEVRFNRGWLAQPFQWRRGRLIFVAAHGDLFHDAVQDEWLDQIFAVMALNPQHIFQLLTKRSARMRDYAGKWFERLATREVMVPHPTGPRSFDKLVDWIALPKVLPNVHFGVSCERQREADIRVPDLLATPAAKRFVSAEPLLGPIDFTQIKFDFMPGYFGDALQAYHVPYSERHIHYPKIDQIITGGESGKGQREPKPTHIDNFRSIRDQCAEAGTAFFHKQNGSWLHSSQYRYVHMDVSLAGHAEHQWPDGTSSFLVGTKAAGALLDGVAHEGRA